MATNKNHRETNGLKSVVSSFKTTRLKASTLPELMVVMILSGIIMGLLFDGVEMFRRYSERFVNHLTENNELLTASSLLTSLIENSDSLRQQEEIVIYRKGAVYNKIRLCDSLLQIGNDTLPLKVKAVTVKTDTLLLETEHLTLCFPTRKKPDIDVIKQIEEKEHETTK